MNGSLSPTARHIEHASALLDVTNETELEAVIRRLVRTIGRETGGRMSDHGERAVVDVVKRAAVETLPTLATVSGTGVGPPIDATPVATAARVLGLELEGLSAEDRDYEIARQLARFAEAAARAAADPRSAGPPGAVSALDRAATAFAPGLDTSGAAGRLGAAPPDSGRWVRRGTAIVLIGLAPDDPAQRRRDH